MVLRLRPPVLGGFGAGGAGETGVSVVEVAGCWRECVEGSSGVARAGVSGAAGTGAGGGAGEAGAAVWVTALLCTSLPSPLVT